MTSSFDGALAPVLWPGLAGAEARLAFVALVAGLKSGASTTGMTGIFDGATSGFGAPDERRFCRGPQQTPLLRLLG